MAGVLLLPEQENMKDKLKRSSQSMPNQQWQAQVFGESRRGFVLVGLIAL
jgi:hypothetical protein